MSELGYLFHDKSSLHIGALDLDVERSQPCINKPWMVGLNAVKSYNTAKGFVNYYICAHYSKGASVK